MELDKILTKPCKKIITKDSNGKENGFVLELFSDRDPSIPEIKGQVYLTVAEPGLFKGYHLHGLANYYVICIKGTVQETVYQNYDTHTTVEIGENNPQMVLIPRGCPHGFLNIGTEPAYVLIYRDPSWDPAVKEQFDIAPEDIEKKETWEKIAKFMEVGYTRSNE